MCTDALIERLPEVLTWSGDGVTFQETHDRYRQTVTEVLGNVLAAINREDQTQGNSVAAAIREASDTALLRVILAPQTSHLLMWEQPLALLETGRFLQRSLCAEAVKEGRPATLTEPTWTALGDALAMPTGEVAAGRSIEGMMPLDFDSPQVRNADPLGLYHSQSPWHPLTDSRREIAMERLATAWKGIGEASPAAGAFSKQFIKVLALQQDDAESSFAAYSTQQYPGRAVISNPQLVDAAQIAEAIVHEAMHALLYMLVQTYPWGVEDPLYDDRPKVASPWTGKMLPISTYLHACFVWYGILHFWSRALATEAFPARRIRGRLSRAALGFRGRPLLELVDAADLSLIAAPIREAIQGMQARVMEAFEPAVAWRGFEDD